MIRTPLRRYTPLRSSRLKSGGYLKRSPMRRVSAKKSRADRELARNAKIVRERSGGRCELRVEGVCLGRAQHPHHIQKRSQGGSHHYSNLLDACDPCNGWVEDHPREAAERGWVIRRGGAA